MRIYMSLLLATLLSTSLFLLPSHAMEGREDRSFEKGMPLGNEAQAVLKEMKKWAEQSGSGYDLLKYMQEQKEQFKSLISKVPQDQKRGLRQEMETIFGNRNMTAAIMIGAADPTENFYRFLDDIFTTQKTTPHRRGGPLPTPPIKKESALKAPNTETPPPLPPRNTNATSSQEPSSTLPPVPLRPARVEPSPVPPATSTKLGDQFKMAPQGTIMSDKDQERIMNRRNALEDSMMTESMLGESQFGAAPQQKESTLEENIQKLEAEINTLKEQQNLQTNQFKRGQLAQLIAAKQRTINEYKNNLTRQAELSKAERLSPEDEETHQQRAHRFEKEARALNDLEQSKLRPDEEWED